MSAPKEQWKSRVGVIMAVAGSAVGLGNFLRFPGQAVENGGGAFMIPYFAALLLLGIPLCWAEWTLGKAGGRLGLHSCPAILGRLGGHSAWRYVGVLGVLLPTLLYIYYVVVESWCLAYAGYYLFGQIDLGESPEQYVDNSGKLFGQIVGIDVDGIMVRGGIHPSVWFWLGAFAANAIIIYRGVSRGIETVCNIAMPVMAASAVIVLIRVLTLEPFTSQTVVNGVAGSETRTVLDSLGFMWNPKPPQAGGDWWLALAQPKVWLAAAGQIFFTLSIGFGTIMTYASYLKPKDDVVLSGLTATATNEFFEVCLGGMITVTAAFLFLGAAGMGGTFGLGFNTLPVVFEHMPAGRVFGFLWFFMLFLAALTSSISLLQPVIAFLEEALGVGRRAAVTLLVLITGAGSAYVIWFSKNLAAIDTLDFWVVSVGIFVFAIAEMLLVGWFFGARRALATAREGAELPPPTWVYRGMMPFVTPAILILVFAAWAYTNAPAYLSAISKGGVPFYSVLVILTILAIYIAILAACGHRLDRIGASGACERCGYDLRGSLAPRKCPECGAVMRPRRNPQPGGAS